MFGDSFLEYEDATFISEADYRSIHSTYQPVAEDIILTKIGTLGNVNVLRESDVPIAIHCNSALLRFPEIYRGMYQLLLCKSNEFYNRMKAAKGQSVQEFVSLDKIGNIVIQLPPTDLIMAFNQTTQPLYEKILSISEENAILVALRNWLLPMLMNGQVTIAD